MLEKRQKLSLDFCSCSLTMLNWGREYCLVSFRKVDLKVFFRTWIFSSEEKKVWIKILQQKLPPFSFFVFLIGLVSCPLCYLSWLFSLLLFDTFLSYVLPFSFKLLSLCHILLCVQVASASVVTEGGAALNRITWTQSGVHVAAGETLSFI